MVRFPPFRWLLTTSRRRNTALAAALLLLLALSTRWHVSYASGTYSQSIFWDPADPQDDDFGRLSSAAAVLHRPLDSDPDYLLENENEPSSSSSSSSSPSSPDLGLIGISDAEQALETLASAYEEERLSHLSSIGYDPSVTEEHIHCPPGSLSPDIDAYISRLESFVSTYFAGSPHREGLMGSLSRMVRAMPAVEGGEFDRVIYTFDKEGPAGTPPEFEGWKQRVTGWKVRVGDDQQVEKWFEECTAGNSTSMSIAGQGLHTGIEGVVPDSGGVKGWNHGHEQVAELDPQAEPPTPPWRSLWDGIDRPVIKADMLRYLVMLIKGGMYTDSDTAPLSDPLSWGTNASSIVSPSLLNLQQGIRRLTSPSPSSRHDRPSENEIDTETEPGPGPQPGPGHGPGPPGATHLRPPHAQGISNPSISIVLSVEYDLDNPLQDPRPGYRRDLQIVQWTFLAKPYHPIFLDALETAVATIEEYRDQGVKENWNEVLDITGPGPFTDAVLRYLLVEYGVAPQEIQNLQQAAIIGDVLWVRFSKIATKQSRYSTHPASKPSCLSLTDGIDGTPRLLPLHAFGSFLDEWEDKWDLEPATRCVAHGFRGRWKWDWSMVPARS